MIYIHEKSYVKAVRFSMRAMRPWYAKVMLETIFSSDIFQAIVDDGYFNDSDPGVVAKEVFRKLDYSKSFLKEITAESLAKLGGSLS